MTPRVTIGIPTYDRLAYLQEAVASALALRGATFEVLISDDGPTETIPAWSRALADQDERVRYQRNAKRLGLAGNWNATVEAARGEFVVIIGDDDRLLPDFLERLVPLLESGADVAFANHHLIDWAGHRLADETLAHTRRFRRDQLPAGELKQSEAVVWQNAVPITAALMRTESVRRLRFREDLNTPEIELFLRLAQAGGRFVFCPDYLAEYRVHPQSATGSGLWGERLAERLLVLPANPEAEPHRSQFLALLLVDAVGRCLLAGQREQARRFLACAEYPHSLLRPSAWVQQICADLPTALGTPVYRAITGFKRRVLC